VIRTIASIAIVFGLAASVVAPMSSAHAQGAPTPEQMEAAKQAYQEGTALLADGKPLEAVEKFKESYRLSKRPVLLYNIGLVLEEAGHKDNALFYLQQFLGNAPKDAKERKDAAKRVDALQKEKFAAEMEGRPFNTASPAVATTTTTTAKPAVEEPKPVKIKPPGTYSASDFEHQTVFEAPPGKPLDITAYVPDDSGFTVTLYYRGPGEDKFTAKAMKWRYKELVGRIPGRDVSGGSIQYYLECKDQGGNLVTRSGKSTSPNLVNIEPGATPRFYPDLTDDGDRVSPDVTRKRDIEEDPLNKRQTPDPDDLDDDKPNVPLTPGNGFSDVGSSKFKYAKWGSTGAAGALLGLSIATYIMAGQQARNLESDARERMGMTCDIQPCFAFDDYDREVQEAGKRYQSIHKVTMGIGIGVAAVAGYFWYRELTDKKRGERKVGAKNSSPETEWVVAPALGEGFAGAAAAARF
jgi:hypothetical protein